MEVLGSNKPLCIKKARELKVPKIFFAEPCNMWELSALGTLFSLKMSYIHNFSKKNRTDFQYGCIIFHFGRRKGQSLIGYLIKLFHSFLATKGSILGGGAGIGGLSPGMHGTLTYSIPSLTN
jgi:hypothetical protein